MRLQGARAVVTGGASGLGLAVAERLVEVGARVVVLDLRRPVALPPGAAYVEADVGSEAAVERAMAEAVDVLGGLTLAVNCAGISHRGRVVGREGPMAQMDFARVVHGQSNRHLPSVPRRGRRHAAQRSGNRMGNVASSSIRPPLPPSMDKSGRSPMPPPRAGW